MRPDFYADDYPHGSWQGFEWGCRQDSQCPNFGSTTRTCRQAKATWEGHSRTKRDYGPRDPMPADYNPRVVRTPGSLDAQFQARMNVAADRLTEELTKPEPTVEAPPPPTEEVTMPTMTAAQDPEATVDERGRSLPPHGTSARYQRGCRDAQICPGKPLTCRGARTEYDRDRRRGAQTPVGVDQPDPADAAPTPQPAAPAPVDPDRHKGDRYKGEQPDVLNVLHESSRMTADQRSPLDAEEIRRKVIEIGFASLGQATAYELNMRAANQVPDRVPHLDGPLWPEPLSIYWAIPAEKRPDVPVLGFDHPTAEDAGRMSAALDAAVLAPTERALARLATMNEETPMPIADQSLTEGLVTFPNRPEDQRPAEEIQWKIQGTDPTGTIGTTLRFTADDPELARRSFFADHPGWTIESIVRWEDTSPTMIDGVRLEVGDRVEFRDQSADSITPDGVYEIVPPRSERSELLATAGRIIDGDRRDTYGDARESFGRIGVLWGAILGGEPVEPWKVALMLTQLKVSRIVSSPDHEDSWVDLLGYGALGGELRP